MSNSQINGSNSTGNYYDGGSTNNKGGASFRAGSSKNLKSVSNKSDTGVYSSVVVDGDSTDKALASGVFSYNNSKPLAPRLTKMLASKLNDAIARGSSAPPERLGINKIDSVITNKTSTGIRDGNFNLSTGKYSSIINSTDSFGTDNETVLNGSYIGGMVYQVGKYPIFSNYNPIKSIGTSPAPSPSPTIVVTATPTVTPTKTLTPTPSASSNIVVSTPTVTPTNTTTPTPSSAVVISTNSANFNNCAANVSSVGTNGRASYYGAYDLSGNIWEWIENSVGVGNKVFRGGNWGYDANYLSSTYRNYGDRTSISSYIGFRVASYNQLSVYPSVVQVGDVSNTADSLTGYGAVSYSYYIGTYEVTNSQYAEFLNSIAKTDTYGLYSNNMNVSIYGGISRSGSIDNYVYTTKTNMSNKPVNFVTWASCARYCNWLHNGKPNGNQDGTTTENGSYDMSLSEPVRTNNATIFIPEENEWYKAAYYKGGSTNAGYWLYATQSNTAPSCVSLNGSGDGIPV